MKIAITGGLPATPLQAQACMAGEFKKRLMFECYESLNK